MTSPLTYSKRAGSKTKQAFKYLIEGEYYSAQQIADRLRVNVSAAHKRMQREKAKPGPITWDGLLS